jgi:hypothetical protein
MRLDQALLADTRNALGSGAIRLFLALELLAAVLFVLRRGSDTVATVALVWLGMATLAFFAWWAGRHRLADPRPEPVPAARARALFAVMVAVGMTIWGFGLSTVIGFVLVTCGLGGWLWSAFRSGGWRGARAQLTRDPRPFVPLLLLIAIPKLAFVGLGFLVAGMLALPSGVGQQLLYLVGLYAPLEAMQVRADRAAVTAALIFGFIHVPLVIDANHGDLVAAMANAVLLQASVGLIACMAYQRHRAVVPIGVAHALAIA